MSKHISTFSIQGHCQERLVTDELYTIEGRNDIFYRSRVDAIRSTRRIAMYYRKAITILLNGNPFCRIYSSGQYEYIYKLDSDAQISNELIATFIRKGIIAA